MEYRDWDSIKSSGENPVIYNVEKDQRKITLRLLTDQPGFVRKYWTETEDGKRVPRLMLPTEKEADIKGKAVADYDNIITPAYTFLVLVRSKDGDQVKIWEVSKPSIMNQLTTIRADRGDLRRLDIMVQRSGDGKETRYSVMDLDGESEVTEDEINKAISSGLDLNTFYDPDRYNNFKASESDKEDEDLAAIKAKIEKATVETVATKKDAPVTYDSAVTFDEKELNSLEQFAPK